MARALRLQGNLPIKFWRECVLTASYSINCTPPALLNGKIPFEMLHDEVPLYTHKSFRLFGFCK